MRHLIIGACVVAIAGCNKPQVDEKNASVEQVAKAVRESGVGKDIFLRAGQWKVTSTMEEMSIPGMPAEAQAEMKRVMGQHQNISVEYCLTPEEAKKPRGKFFTGKDEGQCRYDHFTMGGGKIDAQMRCDNKPGAMTMAMIGTYSADSYATQVTMNMQGGPQGGMTMKMRSEAKRIGECQPKKA